MIKSHHVWGAGVIATLISGYHFASQWGLLKPSTIAAINNLQNGSIPIDERLRGSASAISDEVQNIANVAGAHIPSSQQESYYGGRQGYDQYTPGQYNQNQYSNSSVGYANPSYVQPSYQQSAGDISVHFSPHGGCTEAIVNEINQARSQIFIQAYSFTSEPIAAACVNAHQRGVLVYAILDKSQETEQYSAADLLANSGIRTMIDAQHAIAHNKIILIDGQTIITGSFNFTTNAENSNAENLLIIHNRPDLYAAYDSNLRHHYEHSKPYVGRGVGRPASAARSFRGQ